MNLRSKPILIFLISLLAFAQGKAQVSVQAEGPKESEISASDVTGVLVQMRQKSDSESKAFLEIMAREGLILEKWYSSLKVASLRVRSKNKNRTLSQWESICKPFQRLEGFKHCELNLKLKTNSRVEDEASCELPNRGDPTPNGFNEILALFKQDKNCELIPRISGNPDELPPHKMKDLSAFWAQEYTGADLVRKDLEKLNLSVPPDLYALWDTNDSNHGSQVSNLIGSPHSSALIPTETKPYTNLQESSDYIGAYEKAFNECKDKNCFPRVINNSMGWRNSELIQKSVENTVDSGSVFVAAAGNDSNRVGEVRSALAEKGKLVLVSSLNPKGGPSSFTNFDEEITIAAPSNEEITSYFDGKAYSFGGTSGAAPQVTGALATFMLITDSRIDTKNAKRLLEKTALPIRDLPTPSTLGHGMLNSYAIYQIALKVNEVCKNKPNKNSCVNSELNQETTFDLKPETKITKALQSKIKDEFPECVTGSYIPSVAGKTISATCESKKDTLDKLRRYSLLFPKESIKELDQIACIFESQGYTKNAEYYHALSDRLKKSNREIEDSALTKLREDLKDQVSLRDSYFKFFPITSSSPFDQELVKALHNPDKSVREKELYELGEIKSRYPEVNLEIAKALQDQDNDVRRASLEALREIKPRDLKVHLEIAKAIQNQNKDVRKIALYALGEIKPKDPKIHLEIAKAIQDQDKDVRLNALYALEEIKPLDPEVLSLLQELLKSDSVHHEIKEEIKKLLPAGH